MIPEPNKTLSSICVVAALLSIVASIAIWMFLKGGDPGHAERFGIFVGLWAPTFLLLSLRLHAQASRVATPLPLRAGM